MMEMPTDEKGDACHELLTRVREAIGAHQESRHGRTGEKINIEADEVASALCAILGALLAKSPPRERAENFKTLVEALGHYGNIDVTAIVPTNLHAPSSNSPLH